VHERIPVLTVVHKCVCPVRLEYASLQFSSRILALAALLSLDMERLLSAVSKSRLLDSFDAGDGKKVKSALRLLLR
jgi:hypothetical protein